jgi:SAM-dependent methyltransferase
MRASEIKHESESPVAASLMEKLRCPECGGKIQPSSGGAFGCRDCGRSFPSVRGAPCLLPESMMQVDPKAGGVEVPEDITEHATGGEYHWNAFGIENLLPESAADREVLLVGCGDAGERSRLEGKGFRVQGFDIHWSPGIDFLGDAHRIPAADESYDITISMQVLEHLHSPWLAVDEMARVLRPGGWLIGSVAFLKAYHGSYFHITHQGMTRLLEGAGLEVDVLRGAQSLTYSLYGGLLPLGRLQWRRKAGAAVDRLLSWMRARYWAATRHLDADEPTERFGATIPLSFRTFDRLRFAPAVVFRARKPLRAV